MTPRMRTALKLSLALSLAFATLHPTAAHAGSYANRGLGLGVGFMKLFTDDATVPDFSVPFWLEGSYYAESGFDVYVRIPLALAYLKVGAPPNGGAGFVFATGGQFGMRYLFMEESLRPFVSAHLSAIVVLQPSAMGIGVGSTLVGPGVGAGVEYFVAESVSLQARGFFDWFIGINCGLSNCQRFSVGGSLTVSTYF